MKNCSLFLIGLFFFMFSSMGWTTDFPNTPKLSVTGEASVFKPADQMEVSLGVATTAENSTQALNENNQRIHQIIANLQGLGLEEEDYKTGHFHIHPIYQKSKDSHEDDRTKIIRYDVVNSIQIKTQKIDLADKIIEAAVQGGANQVERLNFNLNNPQVYRAEAIQLAMQNAFANAFDLAKAAGIKVKRILNLSLDHWQQFPGPVMLSKQMEIGGEGDQLPLKVGKVEIHVTVNLTFEIDPAYNL